MIETLLIALSLSMDAFAVSLSAAACSKRLTRFHMLRAAIAFGLFQFLMPVAGWLLGTSFSALISGFDHWVAFGLLALVGGKMLFEVYEEWKEEPDPNACPADAAEKRETKAGHHHEEPLPGQDRETEERRRELGDIFRRRDRNRERER